MYPTKSEGARKRSGVRTSSQWREHCRSKTKQGLEALFRLSLGLSTRFAAELRVLLSRVVALKEVGRPNPDKKGV